MPSNHIIPLTTSQRLQQAALMRIRPASLSAFLKQIIGVKRLSVKTQYGTFSVDPISNLGYEITNTGEYEPAMRKILQSYLKEGSVFVDLGANEGYFTVIGAQLCGNVGRVLAIEPQERLLNVINQNLKVNSVENVTVANVAITDHSGEETLHLASDLNTGSSGLHRATKYRVRTQQVASVTLEALLNERGILNVDLLKVDIEGFEYEALLGSVDLFRKQRIKALALELHPWILSARGKPEAHIRTMLLDCGYMTAPNHSTVWIPAR